MKSGILTNKFAALTGATYVRSSDVRGVASSMSHILEGGLEIAKRMDVSDAELKEMSSAEGVVAAVLRSSSSLQEVVKFLLSKVDSPTRTATSGEKHIYWIWSEAVTSWTKKREGEIQKLCSEFISESDVVVEEGGDEITELSEDDIEVSPEEPSLQELSAGILGKKR